MSYERSSFPILGRAIAIQRMAHLYIREVPLIPRLYDEMGAHPDRIGHHPGAKIASHFFIDHGRLAY